MSCLKKDIVGCQSCAEYLPFEPKPIVQFSQTSKIVIIGQAPGRIVHNNGIAWNDNSGDTLRKWLGIERADFYNDRLFATIPMGFCYPGTGKSGDLPPRPECAPKWHNLVLATLEEKKLTLLIGKYAQEYYLKNRDKSTLTDTVKNYRQYLPEFFPLPHPSARNNIWFKKNSWFETDVLPELKLIINGIL